MDFKIPDTPEELFRQGRRGMHHVNKWLAPILVILVVLGFILSGFYSIEPDEVGVIRRFGKYVRTTSPGLHFKLPFNIEQLNKVPVTRVFKEEFGFRALQPGVNTRYSPRSYDEESLMLTGDLNVLDVTWIVQFRFSDPVKVLFNIRDVRATVRDLSESVMRQVIGDSSVSEALTLRRDEINNEFKDMLQDILDNYESGVQIRAVKLQDVNPPDEVKPSFNEVNEAKQEKEKMINQAWEAYNKAIPKARGTAKKTVQQAEGYALQRVNKARGDAANFMEIWNSYKKAKDVTRKRIYLETMEEIIPKVSHVYIVDPENKNVLPLLNIRK